MLGVEVDPSWEEGLEFETYANQITDEIYLGSEEAAHVKIEQLVDRKITHILMVGTQLELGLGKYKDNKEMNYLRIQVQDETGSNLQEHFRTAILFIGKAVEKKEKVLVHCVMGFSRSPTVVAAWLMYSEGLSSGEALAKIQSKRDVGPNGGFRAQLKEFESRKEQVMNSPPPPQETTPKKEKQEKKRCC